MPRVPSKALALVSAAALLLLAFHLLVSRLTSFATSSPAAEHQTGGGIPLHLHQLISTAPDANHPDYAYVQFATNRQYLCNALINVHRLRASGTRASLAVIVPEAYLLAETASPIGRLRDSLADAEVVLYYAKLDVPADDAYTDLTYVYAFMKLEVLKLPYRTVIYFDNDGLVLRNMDELFLIPPSPIALPRAWWLRHEKDGASMTKAGEAVEEQRMGTGKLCSAFMVVQPSLPLYDHANEIRKVSGPRDFDMEIINRLSVANDAMILPHRNYLLLSSLFRSNASRSLYLGPYDHWDPKAELESGRYLHFSDYPIPKPWGIVQSKEGREAFGDAVEVCGEKGEEDVECVGGRIWQQLYADFRDEMQDSCPSPYEQWPPGT